MSILVVNTVITVRWSLSPNATPPLKTDFDIHLLTPANVGTYTDDGITTYIAPTATARGLATYTFTPTQLGKYEITLSTGIASDFIVDAHKKLYIVNPPAHVFTSVAKTTQGPEIIPPIP